MKKVPSVVSLIQLTLPHEIIIKLCYFVSLISIFQVFFCLFFLFIL
jgi:hypothetical protein